MRDLLRGWRRKVGVVTLLMACVFTGGWVKSRSLTDIVTFNFGTRSSELFYSFDSSLVWLHFQEKETARATTPEWDTVSKSRYSFFEDPDCDWNLRGAGFGFGSCSRKSARIVITPYGAIAVPLAVISAYLIFWKPRKAKPSDPPRIRREIQTDPLTILGCVAGLFPGLRH